MLCIRYANFAISYQPLIIKKCTQQIDLLFKLEFFVGLLHQEIIYSIDFLDGIIDIPVRTALIGSNIDQIFRLIVCSKYIFNLPASSLCSGVAMELITLEILCKISMAG